MPRKRYEYTTIENVNTLRLTVDFAKLYPVSVVEEAYYILSTKGKKKSAYIVDAIDVFKQTDTANKTIERALLRLKTAHLIKTIYNIDSEKKAEEMLSIKTDSSVYKAILDSIPEIKKPAKMLCGFKIDNPKSIQTHTELFNMTANERVLLISNAVVNYVLQGLDPEMEKIIATKMLLSCIEEYNKSFDKNAVLKNFMIAINYDK